jgi:hypothetical protein
MPFRLGCRTPKTAVLYLVPNKSYSKNSHTHGLFGQTLNKRMTENFEFYCILKTMNCLISILCSRISCILVFNTMFPLCICIGCSCWGWDEQPWSLSSLRDEFQNLTTTMVHRQLSSRQLSPDSWAPDIWAPDSCASRQLSSRHLSSRHLSRLCGICIKINYKLFAHDLLW